MSRSVWKVAAMLAGHSKKVKKNQKNVFFSMIFLPFSNIFIFSPNLIYIFSSFSKISEIKILLVGGEHCGFFSASWGNKP